MASATVDSAVTPTATEPPLHVDSLPTVDLRCLSQTELYSLSLCSPSTFDPLRCDDVVIPKIDRSVFNESAGSRKQTYSRLRLAPASDSAAAAASSPSSLRRRTPHLRQTNTLPYQYLDSDPEKGENQQILELLKKLFGLDSSVCINEVSHEELEELVPIRVDYSDSLPHLDNDPHFVPQSSNVGLAGQKRRRGRPRKIENVPLMLVENKVESQIIQISQCSNNNNFVSTMNNQIVVYENEEERDRDMEIVNRDGVEVDLVALGAMHDPYEPELMRRTHGMGTEEELLEFLKGLDGQWGSRRKKRRIVDANEFGNVLPNGWSLLLSVKKKDGHVWLFCRRYISPNGRQLESCKEISSYLLALRGIQGANQVPCAQSNTYTETANSMGFDSTVGLAAVDQMREVIPALETVGLVAVDQMREVNPACQVLQSAVASTPNNFQVEVALNTEDLTAVQVGVVLHCEKCNLSFAGQNDLFQHQLFCHRRKKSKGGESITDGVIIKDGKYECQFCHKTFIERHRYNGHIGAHVRYQGKGSDESRASTAFDLIPQGTLAKNSFGSESNLAAETHRTDADYVLNSYSPHTVGNQNGEFKEANDKVGGVNEILDVDAPKPSLSFKSEAVFVNNENNDCCGTLGGVDMIKRVADGIDAGSETPGSANVTKRITTGIEAGGNGTFDIQGMESESCPSFTLDGKTGGIGINITGLSFDVEEAQGEAACGSGLLDSKENVGSSSVVLDGVHLSHTKDELRFEGEKYVTIESVPDFVNKHDGPDVSSGTGDQQHFESDGHLCKNVDNVDGQAIYSVSGSGRNLGSGYSMLTASGDRDKCSDTNVNTVLPKTSSTGIALESGNMYTYVSKECGSTGESTKDVPTSLKVAGGIGHSTVLSSWNEHVNFTHKYNNEVSSCFVDGSEQLKDSESRLTSSSAFKVNSGVEQYVDVVSAGQMEAPKVTDVQYVTNNELVFPFSSRNSPRKMDALTSNKNERRLEFRSFFPSENTGDSITNFHKSFVEESNNQPPRNFLLAESLISGASHKAYNMDNIYATQVEESKLNDAGNSKNHDLCLASDSRTNCSSVQLESYPVETFDVESGIKQMLGIRSNLNNDANISPTNPREVRAFGFDLHDSAFSERTYNFENNINMIYPGKVWEGPKIDEAGNSGKKFMVGFDGNNPQPVDDVISGGIWRTTGEENLVQTGSANTSTPSVQSANCFHNFDAISGKGEGLFGVNQKYDGGIVFEGLRLGRTEPVEYSFMTSQSSNSLPGESKGFQYDVNTGQSFDSSFWLGRDALMPHATGPNQEPTVCVWCRSEFYQEPIPTGVQTGGAIGSMCPDCSSRVSPQFNV